MTEPLPEIILGVSPDNDDGIAVVGNEAFVDIASLLARLPSLREPGNTVLLAQAVNNFARTRDYTVIEDPAAFQAAYQAKMATEDPNAPWREGIYNLRDYGAPDFATLHPPSVSGDEIIFFAQNALIGLPYRVTATLGGAGAGPVYTPLPLTPVDAPRPVVDDGDDEKIVETDDQAPDEAEDEGPLSPDTDNPFDDA